jgi:hypothetical protein
MIRPVVNTIRSKKNASFAARICAALAAGLVLMASTGESKMDEGGAAGRARKLNALAGEKSPYLIQHATNPVNWRPWGEEAFETAARENKPVLLSIGYSACHWCHVMERESFEDEETARILNDNFVSVKVDREERPDIDAVYMAVCQLMTGGGGWPLTVVLSPDKKPFFAGTYFPPEDRHNLRSFKSVLNEISSVWTYRRNDIDSHAERVALALVEMSKPAEKTALDASVMDKAFRNLEAAFDDKRGGFGVAPKFPTPHNYTFLLRHWKNTGDQKALRMVERSLRGMAEGGINDHLGGGFHRYSVDGEWLVPHFEKMLYDQALLARAYLEAYQATGDRFYADVARSILDYVLQDLTGDGGGFLSAEDADSDGSEGAFYVWNKSDIERILGGDSEAFCDWHGVTEQGNFEHGTNILHTPNNREEFLKTRNLTGAQLDRIINGGKAKLLAERNKRARPLKDDKVIVSWNGLMISSMAYGAQVLDDPKFAQAADRAADFIAANMRADGKLRRRWREGEAAVPAFLDDYAFLIMGLIDLYEATFDPRRVEQASRLAAEMIEKYHDAKNGGFRFSGEDNEKLIGEIRAAYDGAEPSGNSVAALALLKLSRFRMDMEMERTARGAIEAFSSRITRSPEAHTQMLSALDFMLATPMEIVIAGKTGDPVADDMIRIARGEFLPNKITVFYPADNPGGVSKIIPLTQFKEMKDGMTTAFVCRDFACRFPTTDIYKYRELLKE